MRSEIACRQRARAGAMRQAYFGSKALRKYALGPCKDNPNRALQPLISAAPFRTARVISQRMFLPQQYLVSVAQGSGSSASRDGRAVLRTRSWREHIEDTHHCDGRRLMGCYYVHLWFPPKRACRFKPNEEEYAPENQYRARQSFKEWWT